MGKKSGAVVETDQRIDRIGVEQTPSQRPGAIVGGQSPWQDEADPSSGAHERQRAFEKRLVQVDVPAVATRIQAGLPDESDHLPSRHRWAARRETRRLVSEHLPGRIADHRVEARPRSAVDPCRRRTRRRTRAANETFQAARTVPARSRSNARDRARRIVVSDFSTASIVALSSASDGAVPARPHRLGGLSRAESRARTSARTTAHRHCATVERRLAPGQPAPDRALAMHGLDVIVAARRQFLERLRDICAARPRAAPPRRAAASRRCAAGLAVARDRRAWCRSGCCRSAGDGRETPVASRVRVT